MSKVMLLIGLLAAVVLTDPPRVLGAFGADGHKLGWKIKKTIDLGRYMPTFRAVGL